MRHHLLPDCLSNLTVGALYWLDSYRRNDADGFARRIENEAKSSEKARALQQTLAREAAYYSEQASEDSWFDDACTFLCPLFDADFRKLTRTIDALKSSAPELAHAMCRSWPDLSRALGGFASCVEKATLYHLVQAGTTSGLGEPGEGYYELLAKGEPREASPRIVPPPKDRDYARFADPLYARCEHDPNNDNLPAEARSACHARELAVEVAQAKKQVEGRAVLDVEQTLRTFTTSLCAVENVAAWGLFVTHQRSFDETQCRWLASTRASFLFRSWAEDDVAAFVRHLKHREVWSQRVASELPRLAKGFHTPCPKEPDFSGTFCRRMWIPGTTWKRVERALAELEPRATKLGEKLCGGWASLEKELGAACVEKAKGYFLSYGHGVGMLEEPEEK
jgi:hypothetical protein